MTARTVGLPGAVAAPQARRTAQVGIVMITRDRRERLLGTLERITRLPEEPPVVVVDNGSSDGTAAAVRERFPAVRVLTPGRNLGAVGRTYGAAALGTPLVAFSDDDSWWEPGALARAAEVFAAHPRLGLAAAATLVGPDAGPDPLNDVLAASPLGREPDLPGPSVLGFLGCAAVARRDAFLEVGGYHPVLHFGAEETLLALDLEAAGWGVAYCPALVARHQPDGAGGAPRPGRAAQVRRNVLLTAWLRRPLRHALVRTVRLALDARTDPAARLALAGAVRRLPAALARRRLLPAPVEARVRVLEGAP
ncbi:glycosyltransferase [Streptomyces albofaciens JCM 4342]|uniref:glycosyltransferase family 2 protein n=1 Tax=Streptomyces albofaciens TaxID=66866 RepID=UPI00123C0D03|nr:glycosyltransferase [Streptomyces albofaciens]KAA6213281.1 glycosyltransferase [Streptomyces albofaciens JCM 4342]